MRLLMIGSLPPPLGGTTVSFRALCDFAARHGALHDVIDTGLRAGGAAGAALRTLVHFIRRARGSDVVAMHFSDRAAITIAPLLALLCRVANKPFVFRQFGGEFDRTFARLPRWRQRFLEHTIFRADAVFVQTKAMMRAFAPLSDRLHWFPTARGRSDLRSALAYAHGGGRLRCLFVGHVSRAKGADVAAEAVSRFANAELAIYGPLVDLAEAEFTRANVSYHGAAPAEQMSEIMSRHDVLLFPTRHPGEGYPGTLVEAAMVGLPIVAHRWQSLPEMFDDEDVFFIDEATPEALASEMTRIMATPDVLAVASGRLLARAPDFDAERVFAGFLATCTQVAASG